jgi:hypothetical protein
MFRNWLNGIDNKDKARILGVSAFFAGLYEHVGITLFLTRQEVLIFFQVISLVSHRI